MVTDNISNVLNELSQLLIEEQNPHAITDRFERIAIQLRHENLLIENIHCKEYYQDADLALVLLMKNEALKNAQFEQATRFRMMEKELLIEKGESEMTRLRTEPYFFEYANNSIIFHFDKNLVNQRLIANLIEGYNLMHKVTGAKKLMLVD